MKEFLKKNIINFKGKSISKKLIVIESDDWGSIRIPNREVSEALIEKGLLNKNDPFDTVDCLENAEDFRALFEVLGNFKDHLGHSPILTANMVMANPDFDAIKENNFKEYKYELFTDTYNKTPKSSEAFEILQHGIQERLITPQFHAREHLNVSLWMRYLQEQDRDFHYAFERDCFSIKDASPSNRRNNIMATYDYYSQEDLKVIEQSIREGLELFETIFNKKSETTICPCYVWDDPIETIFNEVGINNFQGSKYQNIPVAHTNHFNRQLRYMGQKDDANTYFIRNCLFEPALNQKIDWVDKCLESVKVAFFWNKPAVIGTHRINFVGGIDPSNRANNLEQLHLLLSRILKKWPEAEFIASNELTTYYN
ncbi:hypothetical protein [Gelidibacter mesophilus]|uniref:hypothetical protein n=1 Tax=Gelidibacter mesophilus TaxID=169050 RepID=UPI000489BAF4|nr:hypothetical protein [Gelidibacter mesophilus]